MPATLSAQTFATIYSFDGADGANPQGRENAGPQ